MLSWSLETYSISSIIAYVLDARLFFHFEF
nr:MAG TPA: hypothetical protein [Caudoviricetes sp.]